MSQPRNTRKRQRVQARRERHAAKRRDLRKQRVSGRKTLPESSRQANRRRHGPIYVSNELGRLSPMMLLDNLLFRSDMPRQRQKVS